MKRHTGWAVPRVAALRRMVAAVMAVGCAAAGAGQWLGDDFERARLAGGPLAWELRGAWAVSRGALVNRYAGRAAWPHEAAQFHAAEPLPVDGSVQVDVVHRFATRAAGYAALRAEDRRTKAFVELISDNVDGALLYRTSDTQPAMKPAGDKARWLRGQFATCAIRWKGYDKETGKGRAELLWAAKADPAAALVPLATVEVAKLRAVDKFELILNADRQRFAARSVAFDNFVVQIARGADPPRGFAAAAGLGQPVVLTWHDVANEQAYVLERAAGLTGPWESLGRLAADTTRYVDRRARPSVLYRYRLAAVNEKGRSPWTAQARARRPGPPLAPSKLRALVRPSGQLFLEWQDNSSNEDGFLVERTKRLLGGWKPVRVVGADTLSIVELVPRGKRFRYRVRAGNLLGHSGWSNVARVRCPEPPRVVEPAGRVVHARKERLPVGSVDIVFDQPVSSPAGFGPDDLTIRAVRHPWHHAVELPKPRITAVSVDAAKQRLRVEFAPPIPDLVEYRIGLGPTIANAEGLPVAAGPIRVAVLVGDEDGDGFVAPAEGARLGKRLAMPPMPIGIMAEDIEWDKEKDTTNVEAIIKLMDAYAGIDFFRVNLWWNQLEPVQGELDARYVGFLRQVLEAAQKRQLPIEIGMRQHGWPLWVCGHKDFNPKLYEPAPAATLAATWGRVAAVCREYPVVFAYWVISEEYPDRGHLDKYLKFLEVNAKALRAAHPGCVVKARPQWAPLQGGHEVTPTVSQKGPQDICMAAGFYPTGWQWTIRNPNPLAPACFNNLQVYRYYAPEEQGGPGGIGEIGFRVAPRSPFGDAERLLAFQRTMALAHDLGLEEYVIWGESWGFSDPATHFPLLVAFRDALTRCPRRQGFDLRLVNDEGLDFSLAPYKPSPEAALSPAFRWLEERGYRFAIAAATAVPLLKGAARVSLDTSEIAGRQPVEQIKRLRQALANVEPTGRVLPWLTGRTGRHSLTGLTCGVDVQFLGTKAVCDAVSLSPTRLQLYAPPATRVRWRKPGEETWHELTTARDKRITIVDLQKP